MGLDIKVVLRSKNHFHQKGQNDIIHTQVLECSVCESALFSMLHGSFELSHSQTRVLHNL